MAEYFYISLFAVVALVVIGALLALSTLLGPRNATPQKLLPYECGIIPTEEAKGCLLYTSPSPRDRTRSRMPSSA